MNMVITGTIVCALTLLWGGLGCAPVQADDAPRLSSPPVFGGVAWGTRADNVKSRMTAQGFTFTEEDLTHDEAFAGSLDGFRVAIVEYFTPDRQVVRTTVAYLVPSSDALQVFTHLEDRDTARFGQPTLSTTSHVLSWKGPVGSGYSLTLRLTPTALFENYDGPAARDEFLRRDGLGTPAL